MFCLTLTSWTLGCPGHIYIYPACFPAISFSVFKMNNFYWCRFSPSMLHFSFKALVPWLLQLSLHPAKSRLWWVNRINLCLIFLCENTTLKLRKRSWWVTGKSHLISGNLFLHKLLCSFFIFSFMEYCCQIQRYAEHTGPLALPNLWSIAPVRVPVSDCAPRVRRLFVERPKLLKIVGAFNRLSLMNVYRMCKLFQKN